MTVRLFDYEDIESYIGSWGEIIMRAVRLENESETLKL